MGTYHRKRQEHADLLGERGGGNFGVWFPWSIACIHSQPCYRVLLSFGSSQKVLHRLTSSSPQLPMN